MQSRKLKTARKILCKIAKSCETHEQSRLSDIVTTSFHCTIQIYCNQVKKSKTLLLPRVESIVL